MQNTAYVMRISDWSSDVCSSDLFFSIVHGGRRYVHMFTASVVASGTGTVTASIFPPLRTSLSVNYLFEIAAPKIEGHVLPGVELSFQLALYHTTVISFSLFFSSLFTLHFSLLFPLPPLFSSF